MRTTPPVDSELMAAYPEREGTSLLRSVDDIPRLRAEMSVPLSDLDAVRNSGVRVTHFATPVSPVPVTVLTPARTTGTAIFHIHGGGLVAGSAHSGVRALAELATAIGATIVSPEYRLAPTHPFPAALDDCQSALEWTAGNSSSLGIDRARIVVLGGSAGGGIAAGLALRLRDAGTPLIQQLMLLQPMLDDRNATPSTHELDDEPFWDRTSNLVGWNAYLAGVDEVPAYAAPARAEDLSGLPPVFLEVGDADIFRDECLDFASRLAHSRVPVELHLWPGAFHGFDAFPSALTDAAVTARIDYLRRTRKDCI
ncbi:MAG: alpha/beta hydrolase [Humibacter sp.]